MIKKLFIILFTLLAVEQAVADECTTCEKQARRSCGENCEQAQNKESYEKCKSQCVSNVCAKTCSLGIPSLQQESQNRNRCERCMLRAEKTCSGPCFRAPEGYSACIKTCGKTTCVDECDLPSIDESDDELRVSDKECQECRDKAYGRCGDSAECIKGEPGYDACRVACSVKRCSDVCDHF